MFVVTNMVAQNYCAAQTKLKPENCSYFQTIDKNSKIHEFIWVGYDRNGSLRWLDLMPNNKVLNLIEISRDEWSIHLQDFETKQEFTADLFKLALETNNGSDKIMNVKDEYEYGKLGADYIKK